LYPFEVADYLAERCPEGKKISMCEVLYRMKNHIEEPPKCLVCGAPAEFIKFSRGYKNYCSKKCLYTKEGQKIRMEKVKHTVSERYNGGVPCDNMYQTEYAKRKLKATMVERYGVDNPLKSKEIRDKLVKTCLEKYGTVNGGGSKEAIEKIKQTCRDKYGVDWAAQSPIIQKRIYGSMMDHGKVSKLEMKFYDFLLTIYDKDDIDQQHKDDNYPFFCDFYIKSKKQYIELNGFWTHGEHPFDKTNKDDLDRLERLKQKAASSESNIYNVAIYVWTDLDVKKIDVAKSNNLNFIAIYGNEIDEVIKVYKEFNDERS